MDTFAAPSDHITMVGPTPAGLVLGSKEHLYCQGKHIVLHGGIAKRKASRDEGKVWGGQGTGEDRLMEV
jgi:hypothetical protein